MRCNLHGDLFTRRIHESPHLGAQLLPFSDSAIQPADAFTLRGLDSFANRATGNTLAGLNLSFASGVLGSAEVNGAFAMAPVGRPRA